jgi:hypothetical protein
VAIQLIEEEAADKRGAPETFMDADTFPVEVSTFI